MKYYPTIPRNKLLMYKTICKNLTNIKLAERDRHDRVCTVCFPLYNISTTSRMRTFWHDENILYLDYCGQNLLARSDISKMAH